VLKVLAGADLLVGLWLLRDAVRRGQRLLRVRAAVGAGLVVLAFGLIVLGGGAADRPVPVSPSSGTPV
jgi:hypothetical protein